MPGFPHLPPASVGIMRKKRFMTKGDSCQGMEWEGEEGRAGRKEKRKGRKREREAF